MATYLVHHCITVLERVLVLGVHVDDVAQRNHLQQEQGHKEAQEEAQPWVIGLGLVNLVLRHLQKLFVINFRFHFFRAIDRHRRRLCY